jgi:hypothetical protein
VDTHGTRRLVARAAGRFVYDPTNPVTIVEIGHREEGGRRLPGVALRFHVDRKLPMDQLLATGIEPVPREYGGLRTDVVEGRYLPQAGGWWDSSGRGRFDPLRGGISLGSARSAGAGTLGAIARDRSTGGLMALSNSHVLATVYGSAPGLGTQQPGALDGGDADDLVGWLARDAAPVGLDASVSRLGGQRGAINHQHGAGPLRGVKAPAVDTPVMKAGRTTGLTSGVITAIEGVGIFLYGSMRRTVRRTMTIESDGGGLVSAAGDSGAVWFDPRDRRAVGLHFAGGGQPPRALAIAIEPVLEALAVDLLVDG